MDKEPEASKPEREDGPKDADSTAGPSKISFRIKIRLSVRKYNALEGPFQLGQQPPVQAKANVELQLLKALEKGRKISESIIQQQVHKAINIGRSISQRIKPEVPDDIKLDIFSRLPINRYFQIKCLSKFFNQHLSESKGMKGRSLLAVVVESDGRKSNELLGVESASSWYKLRSCGFQLFEVVGACKGLLCMYTRDVRGAFHYLLFNPVTGERLILPHPLPESRIVMHGFGEAGGVLKLAVFSEIEQAVLTIGTADWVGAQRRQRSVLHQYQHNFRNRDMVLLNGALHWLSSTGILQFDLNKLTLEEIRIPNFVLQDHNDMAVAVGKLRGRFCVLVRCELDQKIYWVENSGDVVTWELMGTVEGFRATIHTRILGHKLHGNEEETLAVVDDGVVCFCHTNIRCSPLGIQNAYSAFSLEPTSFSLKELGIHAVDHHLMAEDEKEDWMAEEEEEEAEGFDDIMDGIFEEENAAEYQDDEVSSEDSSSTPMMMTIL